MLKCTVLIYYLFEFFLFQIYYSSIKVLRLAAVESKALNLSLRSTSLLFSEKATYLDGSYMIWSKNTDKPQKVGHEDHYHPSQYQNFSAFVSVTQCAFWVHSLKQQD